jgi:hypothetical protein
MTESASAPLAEEFGRESLSLSPTHSPIVTNVTKKTGSNVITAYVKVG